MHAKWKLREMVSNKQLFMAMQGYEQGDEHCFCDQLVADKEFTSQLSSTFGV